MKVLIIGINGWIGSKYLVELNRFGHQVEYSEARAESNELIQDIEKIKPTHILYCAGRTHGTINGKTYNNIDYLEEPDTLDINLNDNLYAPVRMAIYCNTNKIHFTYINTGCIYNYDTEHTVENKIGFKEIDKPNFKGSKYSLVRGFTDNLMRDLNILNLRIRLPVSDDINDRNLLIKLSKFTKITNIPNSISILPDLIPISIAMMEEYELGTFNLVNPEPITHNEILELYKEIINPEHKWEIVEDNISKVPRSNVILNTDKIKKYNISNTIDSIKLCLNRIKSKLNYGEI